MQQEFVTNAQKRSKMQDLEKIKEALQDRVVSIVADKTGLSRNTINAIKSGTKKSANASTIKVLADYLGVCHDR